MAMRIVMIISEAEITNQEARQGFARKVEMPQIVDPDNPGEMIDEFPSVRRHMGSFGANKLLRAINQGNALIAEDTKIAAITMDSVTFED